MTDRFDDGAVAASGWADMVQAQKEKEHEERRAGEKFAQSLLRLSVAVYQHQAPLSGDNLKFQNGLTVLDGALKDYIAP